MTFLCQATITLLPPSSSPGSIVTVFRVFWEYIDGRTTANAVADEPPIDAKVGTGHDQLREGATDVLDMEIIELNERAF